MAVATKKAEPMISQVKGDTIKEESRKESVRSQNIIAAKCKTILKYTAVSDTLRTSLGPRGMDKMVIVLNVL